MTAELALRSSAVALTKGNTLFARFRAIAEENQKLVATAPDATLGLLERLIDPITALISGKVLGPPKVTSAPSQPSTVTKEGNGTRVEQRPEA